jgi:hypothetical protein
MVEVCVMLWSSQTAVPGSTATTWSCSSSRSPRRWSRSPSRWPPVLRLLVVVKAFKVLKLSKAIKLAKLGKACGCCGAGSRCPPWHRSRLAQSRSGPPRR